MPYLTSITILANGCSFVAGLLANYFLSTFWVFRSSGDPVWWNFSHSPQSAWWDFTDDRHYKGQRDNTDITSAYQMIGKVVSTMVAFLWNFFARKYLLFSKKEA
ncbi:MAG: hypothetical protein ACLT3Y_04580 [Ruminococcus callidus]